MLYFGEFACCCIRTMNLPDTKVDSWVAQAARQGSPELIDQSPRTSKSLKFTLRTDSQIKSTRAELRTPNSEPTVESENSWPRDRHQNVLKWRWMKKLACNWTYDGWCVMCVCYILVCVIILTPHTQRLTKVSTIIPLCMAQFTMHTHHPELEK